MREIAKGQPPRTRGEGLSKRVILSSFSSATFSGGGMASVAPGVKTGNPPRSSRQLTRARGVFFGFRALSKRVILLVLLGNPPYTGERRLTGETYTGGSGQPPHAGKGIMQAHDTRRPVGNLYGASVISIILHKCRLTAQGDRLAPPPHAGEGAVSDCLARRSTRAGVHGHTQKPRMCGDRSRAGSASGTPALATSSARGWR
ncbi:MAG: hypothetical protein KatS3mg058_3838 [Roseiflexus sp.]|nr:MAG: hypothetical protein KatS3mg058_3838 [Roseiflexus sp.]